MTRYALKLEETYAVLERHNGEVAPAAKELEVAAHTLNSFIDKYAELQAIVRNKDIEIRDQSRKLIHEYLFDATVNRAEKIPTAKWVMERRDPEQYGSKTELKLKNTADIENMSEAEVDAFIAQQGYVKKDDGGVNS